MEVFQPRFPISVGGRYISFLRIGKAEDISFVMKITNQNKKHGEIIAECRLERDLVDGSYEFITTTEHAGHIDLCRLLQKKGVSGRYAEWLYAVENGDETSAKEKESLSEISFECLFIGKVSDWKFE